GHPYSSPAGEARALAGYPDFLSLITCHFSASWLLASIRGQVSPPDSSRPSTPWSARVASRTTSLIGFGNRSGGSMIICHAPSASLVLIAPARIRLPSSGSRPRLLST